VPFTGIFDYARAVKGATRLEDYAVELLGGGLEEKPETWAEASPATWVDGSEPPFLIIHGAEDANIPPGNSEDFYDLLVAAGVDAELLMIRGATHAEITRSPESLEAVEAFLAQLLQ
jgi:dipeptidyl aminopeptidase/acylaminoacyl peptidase